MTLSHEQIQELLGAYALDAVDADERDVIDEHLVTCVRCRAEVTEHRETAALLAFAGQDAPTGVWDRISASLEEPPPPMAIDLATKREARRSKSWRLAGLGAAAAVVISVLALGVALRDDDDVADEFQTAVADQPRIVLTSADGDHSVDVVIVDDQGYLFNDNLPALPEDQVYQLWGRRGTDLISLGLLGNDPDRERFVAGDEFDAFAITVEEAGGVVASTQPAVVAGEFTA